MYNTVYGRDIQNYSPTVMFRGTPCICTELLRLDAQDPDRLILIFTVVNFNLRINAYLFI